MVSDISATPPNHIGNEFGLNPKPYISEFPANKVGASLQGRISDGSEAAIHPALVKQQGLGCIYIYILGLYTDNGKNGNYYNGVILGLGFKV